MQPNREHIFKLSHDCNYPELATGKDICDPVSSSDAAADSRFGSLSGEVKESGDIQLVCRLGERLFHAGHLDDAAACGRRAFAVAADDHGIAHFCGIMAQRINAKPLAPLPKFQSNREVG